MRIDITAQPRTTSSPAALTRTFLIALLAGLPLAALMLTPSLMRSRVELAPGASAAGIVGFVVLSALLVLLAPALSAAVAPAPGWRFGTASRVSRALRRALPRAWWLRLGEAGLGFVASQLVGGGLAALVPHLWRDETGTGWVLSYPNYALQAVSMYLVIVLAAAWFGTRIRRLALGVELVADGRPVT